LIIISTCGSITPVQQYHSLSSNVFIEEEYKMALQVGQRAPDFALKTHDGRMVRLSDYRGKQNVVIAFFPLAWTPV
jgi:peroxiredoxin